MPVHYFFRSLPPTELLAFYRAAEIALITPLKDGMNLVAKEFCACSLEEDSVLILSQFAGAAAQLGRAALVVNPYDVEQTADAIYNAFRMAAGRAALPHEASAAERPRLRTSSGGSTRSCGPPSTRNCGTSRCMEEYIPEHYQ